MDFKNSLNGRTISPFILALLFCFLAKNSSAQVIIIEIEIPLVGSFQASSINGNISSISSSSAKASQSVGPIFQVSPNPVIDHLTISSLLPVNVRSLSIIDGSGNAVFQASVSVYGGQLQVQGLKPGNYILRLETSSGVYTENILVAQ